MCRAVVSGPSLLGALEKGPIQCVRAEYFTYICMGPVSISIHFLQLLPHPLTTFSGGVARRTCSRRPRACTYLGLALHSAPRTPGAIEVG